MYTPTVENVSENPYVQNITLKNKRGKNKPTFAEIAKGNNVGHT